MVSLFIKKIIYICKYLLFGNTKITFRNFIRKCKKQKIKIIRVVAERYAAFLKSLPKNYALFQALEPAFEYILQEQLSLSEKEQNYIFKIEKLEFKKHIMIYEYVGYKCVYNNYPHLFNKYLPDIMDKKYIKYHLEDPLYSGNEYKQFTALEEYLGEMWLKYGDNKNLKHNRKCDAYLEDFDIHLLNVEIVSSRSFETFRDIALSLLSDNSFIIDRIDSSSVIQCE